MLMATLSLDACSGTFGEGAIATLKQRTKITSVGYGKHHHWEKNGISLDENKLNDKCGEEFQIAVTGVPEAERKARSCSHDLTTSILLYPLSIVTLVSTSTAANEMPRGVARDVTTGAELAVGLSLLVAAVVLVFRSGNEESDAVQIYNDSLQQQ